MYIRMHTHIPVYARTHATYAHSYTPSIHLLLHSFILTQNVAPPSGTISKWCLISLIARQQRKLHMYIITKVVEK